MIYGDRRFHDLFWLSILSLCSGQALCDEWTV
jgi:hypothetical protein